MLSNAHTEPQLRLTSQTHSCILRFPHYHCRDRPPVSLYSEPAVHPPWANETCAGERECARLGAFAREWATGMGLAQGLRLRSPADLPHSSDDTTDPSADPSVDPSADTASPPPPESEGALYVPYYLFGDARVAWGGWLAPRPRSWASSVHLVGFARSFSLVRSGFARSLWW